MENFRDIINRRRNDILVAVIVSFVMFLSGCYVTDNGHVKIRKLNNFTAIYIEESANVILLGRNIEVILKPKELGVLIRFTRACLLCKSYCSVKSGAFSLKLGPGLYVNMLKFLPCTIPNHCIWHGYTFMCQDLIGIVNLVT